MMGASGQLLQVEGKEICAARADGGLVLCSSVGIDLFIGVQACCPLVM
jgi:hypothetical protein